MNNNNNNKRMKKEYRKYENMVNTRAPQLCGAGRLKIQIHYYSPAQIQGLRRVVAQGQGEGPRLRAELL